METSDSPWYLKHPRICAAVLACAFSGFIVAISRIEWNSGRQTNLPAVTALPSSYTIPRQAVPIPDRWIPRSWRWLRQFKEAVLGKPESVSIHISAFQLDPAFELLRSEQPDFVTTNGAKIWLLSNPRIQVLVHALQAMPRSGLYLQGSVTSADRGVAAMNMRYQSSGSGLILSRANVLPVFHSDMTELTTVLTSERFGPSISQTTTNFAAALRVLLPIGDGFVLLEPAHDGDETMTKRSDKGSDKGGDKGEVIEPAHDGDETMPVVVLVTPFRSKQTAANPRTKSLSSGQTKSAARNLFE